MNFFLKYLLTLVVVVVVVIVVTFCCNQNIYSWGFHAHKKINRMAVFTLPPDMISFYKKHIDYLTEHAVDADKRRYSIEGEAPRHYIDIDHYVKNGENPINIIPRTWKDAVQKYTEDTLKEYGIVPWYVNLKVINLTKAFEKKDVSAILKESADLGHYVADSHVPLHTTENYNGQYTGQHGIHGLWESRLPELKSDDYNFFVGRAVYVRNILKDEWETIVQSFAAKDSVLNIEKQLSSEFPRDQKYSFEDKGRKSKRVYSREYSLAYHQKLNGMVERRMKRAIFKVGSYWYTAWLNAGQPKLDELISIPLKPSEEKNAINTRSRNIDRKRLAHDN